MFTLRREEVSGIDIDFTWATSLLSGLIAGSARLGVRWILLALISGVGAREKSKKGKKSTAAKSAHALAPADDDRRKITHKVEVTIQRLYHSTDLEFKPKI